MSYKRFLFAFHLVTNADRPTDWQASLSWITWSDSDFQNTPQLFIFSLSHRGDQSFIFAWASDFLRGCFLSVRALVKPFDAQIRTFNGPSYSSLWHFNNFYNVCEFIFILYIYTCEKIIRCSLIHHSWFSIFTRCKPRVSSLFLGDGEKRLENGS